MNKARKWGVAAVVTLLMACALCGCSRNTDDTTSSTSDASSSTSATTTTTTTTMTTTSTTAATTGGGTSMDLLNPSEGQVTTTAR